MSKQSFISLPCATGVVTALCVITASLAEVNQGFYVNAVISSFASIWLTCKCTWREAWTAIGVSWIASVIGMCMLDSDIIVRCVLSLLLMSLLQACIAMYKTTRRTVEVAGEAILWVVNQFVDLLTLKKEVKRKCPTALKMMIMEKKKNALHAGVFSSYESNTPSQFITIESTEGISSDIEEGKVYMLND